MAGTSRAPTAPLGEQLVERGHEFSFFQAMRLLRLLSGEGTETVRVRPELTLTFPPADVAGIEKREDGYRVTATFLGLYGPASPLPTFYTEELLDERAADAATGRDFLDIVNQRLFALWYDAVAKYRLFHRVAEEAREVYLERLFCLVGLGGEPLRRELSEPRALLRHVGILSQYPRSAMGLATLLGDLLGVPVQVIQCLQRRVPVPPDQRLRLGATGCSLGTDTVVGDELTDRTGKFRLQLGPLDRPTFAAFLPGTPGRCRLDALVGYYLAEPLAWDLELQLIPGAAPATTIGGAGGSRLGWDSWLAPGRSPCDTAVVFPGSD